MNSLRSLRLLPLEIAARTRSLPAKSTGKRGSFQQADRTKTIFGLLFLAVFFSSMSYSGGDLSPLERELRGFMRNVNTLTARQALPLSGRLEKRTSSTSFSSSTAKARVEISSGGQVTYSLSSLGVRAKATSSDIQSWISEGTSLDLLGFTVGHGYIDIGVRPSRSLDDPSSRTLGGQLAKTLKIRVLLPVSNPTCRSVIASLSIVLDFGSASKKLHGLESEFSDLSLQLQKILRRLDEPGFSFVQGQQKSLRQILNAAVENRKAYGDLVQAEPGELHGLEQRLREISVREEALNGKLAQLVTKLVAAVGSAPGHGASYSNLETWAQTLTPIVTEVARSYAECMLLGCEEEAEAVTQWRDLENDLKRFEEGVARSIASRCSSPEPISRGQLEVAVANEVPDSLIARRVSSCGVSFGVDDNFLSTLRRRGDYAETATALRYEEAFRLTTEELRSRLVSACARSLSEIPRISSRTAEIGQSRNAAAPGGQDLPIIQQGSLFWTGSSLGRMTWVDARNRCANLTIGGRRWRLPSIGELEAFSRSGIVGQLSAKAQVQIVGCCIWSGTTKGDNRIVAFDVEKAKKDRMSRRLGLASVLCVSE